MGCLNAWLWLTFRGYGDTEPLLFNDEFGRLFAVLPCAAAALLLMGLFRERLRREGVLAALWNAGSACMMIPALAGLNIALFSGPTAGTLLSLLAGFGFAAGFMVLGVEVAALSRPGILVVVGGGIIASRVLIHGLLALPTDSLILLPVVFALAARLLLEPPESPEPGDDEDAPGSPRRAADCPWPVYAVYALTGMSHGLYYSLLAVMEPLLPRPKPHLLLIAVLSCLISPLCIHLARRASIWRTVLLMGPLLVVGYTAWPLLHRESPALSLDSLHFAYALLGVYSYITLFFAALRLHGSGSGIRLIGFGGAILLFSLLLGTYALPCIRASLSQGTTVNYLFAFLAVTILISSFAFVYLLERLGFWASPYGSETKGVCRPLPGGGFGDTPPQAAAEDQEKREEDRAPAQGEVLSLEQCAQIFRKLGLTRQQALIAAMLAKKRQDVEICADLNISPSTLKTHIRNILRRLNINSRHELPWLISRAVDKTVGEE